MKNLVVGLGAVLFITLLALLTFGQAVGLDLSHDEHQFIAPAVLWEREGLLPYRDVPLFHQPYLIFLDSLAVKNAASPLLATRLISGIAAFLTGLLIFGCAWIATSGKSCSALLREVQAARQLHPAARRMESVAQMSPVPSIPVSGESPETSGQLPALPKENVSDVSSPFLRLAACISVTLLWLTSHLFLVSSGRTWNHDLPSLLAISAMAILLFCKKPNAWHWLAAGLLAGLATGGRLTFSPFAGLLPLTALLWTSIPMRTRLFHLISCGLGVALALLPSAWLYLQSPESYLFGNFEFPRLPLLEADNSRILKTITPWRKLRFFFKEIFLSHLPLALSTIALGILYLRQKKIPWHWIVPTLALVAGAFAPSRYEMQHFYIVAPLAALLIACFLKTAPIPAIHCLAGAAVISCLIGGKIFLQSAQLFHPQDWDVTRIHQQGIDLRSKVPGGKILTLGPIVALEGGFSIYPQLATGRFGWKFAYLVPQPRRSDLHLLADVDLAAALAKDPPVGIITGNESEKLEKPLLRYARKARYIPEPFTDKTILWRRP